MKIHTRIVLIFIIFLLTIIVTNGLNNLVRIDFLQKGTPFNHPVSKKILHSDIFVTIDNEIKIFVLKV